MNRRTFMQSAALALVSTQGVRGLTSQKDKAGPGPEIKLSLDDQEEMVCQSICAFCRIYPDATHYKWVAFPLQSPQCFYQLIAIYWHNNKPKQRFDWMLSPDGQIRMIHSTLKPHIQYFTQELHYDPRTKTISRRRRH